MGKPLPADAVEGAEPYSGPVQPTIEFANALMDAYNAAHWRNLELEAKVADLERRLVKPVVGSMEEKRFKLLRNLYRDGKPDPRTFRPIAEHLEEAAATGPVPTYTAVNQWHGELEQFGLARTYAGVRNGCVMCPRAFAVKLEAYRKREAKRLAKREAKRLAQQT